MARWHSADIVERAAIDLRKINRHWRHFTKLCQSPPERVSRMLSLWRRWYRVRPRGYSIDSGLITFERV